MRTTLTTRRPVASLAIGSALALALTACGSSNDSTAAPSSSSSSTAQDVDATHNEADVRFLGDMAPHHSGAIAMAELAAGQAGSAQVKDLANRISAAQGPEIVQMKAMAAAWRVTLNTDADAMTGLTEMHGMASSHDDLSALKPLSGTAFDREFVTRMTAHHMSAVMMAQTESVQGSNPQAKQLAAAIVAAQQKEIAEMAGLLTSA